MMEAGGFDALLRREQELLEDFLRLTHEQHEILTQPETDEQQLNRSLADRRRVLEEFEQVFGELAALPEAQASRADTVAALERALEIDAQNLELCGKAMKSISEQAKQMAQNRKVVTGYSKTTDVLADTSGFFDKRQ